MRSRPKQRRPGALGLLRLKCVERRARRTGGKVPRRGRAARLGLQEGDLALFVAGADRVSSPALDRVRQDVARRLNLVPDGMRELPVGDGFPDVREGRDDGRARCGASPVHGAACPRTFRCSITAPERARAQAYDFVFNGTELGGGSIRISDPGLQSRMFALLGIDEATAQARFGFLLEGLRAGAPPHGGIAFGFDRIAMQLANAGSLRDVIAFPKTTAARALFEGAPAPVPPARLD